MSFISGIYFQEHFVENASKNQRFQKLFSTKSVLCDINIWLKVEIMPILSEKTVSISYSWACSHCNDFLAWAKLLIKNLAESFVV